MTTTSVRKGKKGEETRSRLLAAAEKIIVGEGYAAISSRRVAQEAGVTPAVVHYHFQITDDLFIALVRRLAEEFVAKVEAIDEGSDAVHAIWELNRDFRLTTLFTEFMALANHRKALGAEFQKATCTVRDAQAALLARSLGENLSGVDPLGLTVLIGAVARTIVAEECAGITAGHQDIVPVTDWLFGRQRV